MKRIVVLVFVLFAATVGAQQRFDATIMAGVNMCQIDGDDAGSYNHVGLRAGVGTSFPLSIDAESPWRMAVELAYTKKGARFDSGAGHTALQYVELPLLLTYNTSSGRLRIGVGVAPALKVGVSVTYDGMQQSATEALYRSMDWLPLTAVVRYRFTDHLCLEGRYQQSMVTVFDGAGPYFLFHSNSGAFNRLFTLGLAYQL